MATGTLLDGESARIITHPRFDRPPVVQHPRRGRFPKSIVTFWSDRSQEIRAARRLAQELLKERESIRYSIAAHEYFANDYRNKLAALGQASNAESNATLTMADKIMSLTAALKAAEHPAGG